jgi:hypothetical protein
MELSTAGGTDLMESQRRFGAGTGLPDHNRTSDLDREHEHEQDHDPERSLHAAFAPAEQELADSRAALTRLGAVEWSVIPVGESVLGAATRVVQVKAGESPGGVKAATRRAKAARAGRAGGRPVEARGTGRRRR